MVLRRATRMADHRRPCPRKWLQPQCFGGVQRVTWLPGTRQTEHQRRGMLRHMLRPELKLRPQQPADRLITIMATAAMAPAAPQIPTRRKCPAMTPLLQHDIPSPPHGISAAQQGCWGGADARKKVDHHQGVIAPVLGKPDQPSKRGIVAMVIRTGGIQPKEQQCPGAGSPAAGQPPAVGTISAETGLRPRDGCGRGQESADWRVRRRRD